MLVYGPSICENCYEVTDEKIYSECISVEPKSAWLTPKGTTMQLTSVK